MEALKAEQFANSKWRVLAIPFGGPFKGGKDLDGEFFSPKTDIKAAWFKDRPVLFHHGQDQTASDEDYGSEEMDAQASKDGWWGTLWLNQSARYWQQVDSMLRAGKMYGSSGSIGHLVRKDHETGEILVWPHAEQTLTPTPANPYARISASKAFAGFDRAGIPVDDTLKSLIETAERQADDLPPDLSADGDEAAMKRLAEALASLEELIKQR